MNKLVLVVFLNLITGCGSVKPLQNKFIDCAVQTVEAKARELLPAMVGILTGGTASWKEQAKALGKQAGVEAAACAVKAALEQIEAPVQSEPEVDPAQVQKAAAARARALIIEEEWKYKLP